MSFQSYGFLLLAALTLGACLPAGRKNRRAGELLLEFLAEEGVTPTHLEEVLAELTG